MKLKQFKYQNSIIKNDKNLNYLDVSSLSELTPIIFYMELTHLDSEASNLLLNVYPYCYLLNYFDRHIYCLFYTLTLFFFLTGSR